MKMSSVRAFVGAECHCERKATEFVHYLWEEYVAWCRERNEVACLPDDFLHGLAELGLQVARGYAYGVSLSPRARRRIAAWQQDLLPAGEQSVR